jgi:hypothetical protein
MGCEISCGKQGECEKKKINLYPVVSMVFCAALAYDTTIAHKNPALR